MYLTIYKKTQTQQPQKIDYSTIMQSNIEITPTQYYKTTIEIKNPTPYENLSSVAQDKIEMAEIHLLEIHRLLMPFKETHEQEYYSFKIPKRSGGFRTINAPNPEFKTALAKAKDIFENNIKCLPHTAAFAYIKQHSIIDSLKEHQKNNSNWFLKIDLTNFFTNCTPELLYEKLIELYPFYYFTNRYKKYLKEILEICCLNGGLPQGTPISPYLTNLLMVSYDYQITNFLKRGTGEHFVYTRYADDILISSKSTFDWRALQEQLQTFLQPFTIKTQKTRYGSKAGQNWNLGLMLNKDNNITLGYQKKKLLNAMLNNFLKDTTKGIQWPSEDVYHLQGQLSWLYSIEPDYHLHILQKYTQKYQITLKDAIKTQLNNI